MAEDMRFYDFDFNLLYILPAYTVDSGYISINAQQDLNNSGSFEALCCDAELKSIVQENKDCIMVVWNGFQGFITSYQKEGKQLRLLGMHLNGLLHRVVIPKPVTDLSGDVETLARAAVTANIPWLTLGDSKGFENSVTYSVSNYLEADKYIQDLLALDGAGYQIRADLPGKRFIFECIKPLKNPLVLSADNLNAYNFQTTYTNKDLSFGGWYEDESTKELAYVSLDSSKEGIYKIDTVLSAKTASEAMNELKKCKAEYTLEMKTKDTSCGVDYNIGDIVRVQEDGVTKTQLVSGVMKWQERGYGEQPILTDYEEAV